VWAIFIFYWIGFVFTLIIYSLALFPLVQGKPVPLDLPDVIASLIALFIRGIATIKLLFLKSDAWIYFAGSLGITLAIQIINCIGQAITHQPLTGTFTTIITFAIWIYITIYAYRICNKNTEAQQDAAANP
jgi:hypothetical protein